MLYEVLYVEPLGKRHLTMKQSIKYLNTRIDHAINECCSNVEITPALAKDDLCPIDCKGDQCRDCPHDDFEFTDGSTNGSIDGYFPY